MNKNDKQYLKVLEKMRPSDEVFKEMVKLLANLKTETDQVLKASLPQKTHNYLTSSL